MSVQLKNLYGAMPVTERGKPVHLGVNPKNNDIVYACGNNVFWRDLKNPLVCDMYTEHQAATTVARVAPSGCYMASADSHGVVRVWALDNPERILKIEVKVLGGPIRDLQWSDDSKRIVAVGEGSDRFGAVFMFDSGSSVGEISGHGKAIQSCDFKQTRPYRVVTGSEDFATGWFEGPPFKWKKNAKDHTRFVNCVRFSPDGNKYLSVGSDKKGFFYDGKTGDKLDYELNGDVHQAGIYSIAWSKDSQQVATSSADKTVKVWDANTGACLKTFSPGGDKPATDDMQVAVIWHAGELISLSLNGAFNYLDFENPNTPKKVVRGHNKFVKAMAFDSNNGKFYTGSYDALMLEWDLATGENKAVAGAGHSNQINKIRVQGDKIISGGMDDSVRITAVGGSFDTGKKIAVDGSVADVYGSSKSDLVVAAARNEIAIIRGGAKVGSIAAPWQPTAVAISHDESEVAVGGNDMKIRLYSVSGNSLTEKKVLEGHRGALTALSYSSNDATLAAADHNRNIFLWNRADGTAQKGREFHTAAVKDLAWSPDNLHLASGGLDGIIFIWDAETPSKRVKYINAHKGGVNAVAFVDNNTLITAGEDCTAKTWTLTH